MTHALWWLIAAVVLGIIEIGTVDFVFLMLAGGALGAGGAAALGAGTALQVGVFALVAILLLVLARPAMKRRFLDSTPEVVTNVHALIGREARVLEAVDAHDGRIRLDGELWSARSRGPLLAVGARVLVEEIDGATAIVAPLRPNREGPRS